MALNANALRLYLVADPILCRGAALLDTVASAIRGGVTLVQLRDKTSKPRTRVDAARALKAMLQGTDIPLIINDYVDVAILADADGVHLGQDDMSVVEARARLGSGKILGLSCETVQEVEAADPTIVDYLGLGTVFPTATKADHRPAIGLSGLQDMAHASTLPTVAIGGLKPEHAQAVLQAGCDGLAVVSAICGQPDPAAAAAELHRAMTCWEETGK